MSRSVSHLTDHREAQLAHGAQRVDSLCRVTINEQSLDLSLAQACVQTVEGRFNLCILYMQELSGPFALVQPFSSVTCTVHTDSSVLLFIHKPGGINNTTKKHHKVMYNSSYCFNESL